MSQALEMMNGLIFRRARRSQLQVKPTQTTEMLIAPTPLILPGTSFNKTSKLTLYKRNSGCTFLATCCHSPTGPQHTVPSPLLSSPGCTWLLKKSVPLSPQKDLFSPKQSLPSHSNSVLIIKIGWDCRD